MALHSGYYSYGVVRAEMALRDHEKGAGAWTRYVPHALMTLVQLCNTILYFFTEAAFNRELKPYVYVTSRHLLVAVLLWPFAYFYEK